MDETPASPASAPAKNTKLLYIVGGIILVLIAGSVVSGMAFRKPGAAYFPGPAGTGVEQNVDGSTTYTTEQGSVTINGGSMPDNWPSDAPAAYTGASILYSGNTNPATGAAGAAVVYTTTASLDSVVTYYTSRLKAEGWTITASTVMQGMHVMTASKGERTFAAYVASANGTTQVTSGVEFN